MTLLILKKNQLIRFLSIRIATKKFAALLLLLLGPTAVHGQIQVAASTVGEQALSLTRSAPAHVVGVQQTDISSELTGRITSIPLRTGDLVDAGDTVAAIECSDYELSLEQARSQTRSLSARKTLAQQQLTRLNKLRQSRNASEDQINQAQAELDVVNAEIASQSVTIRIAEHETGKCAVLAPFSGVIIQKHVHIGAFVSPGTPLMNILNTESVEVSVRLNLAQQDELANSASQVFEFDGESFPVTVRTILPIIDGASQSQELRMALPERKPPTGATGRLQWALSGIILPADFLQQRGGKPGVFIVDGTDSNTAVFHQVSDAVIGRPVKVDLPAETVLITDGRFALSHGDAIQLR
ncbi:MAG: efflux RND transporter periplasmic adaptor subunit [Pseudomonadota bacterium]